MIAVLRLHQQKRVTIRILFQGLAIRNPRKNTHQAFNMKVPKLLSILLLESRSAKVDPQVLFAHLSITLQARHSPEKRTRIAFLGIHQAGMQQPKRSVSISYG